MHSMRPHSGVIGVDELVECHTFFCVINGGTLTQMSLQLDKETTFLISSFTQSFSLVKTRYIMSYLKTDVMSKSSFY